MRKNAICLALRAVVGSLAGLSGLQLAKFDAVIALAMRNFLGHKFWARRYFVTTIGRDEDVIRLHPKPRTGRTGTGGAELGFLAVPKSNPSSRIP
jgi:putative transposase